MDEAIAFGTLYGAAIAYLPAKWLMIGIVILLTGFTTKTTGLIWLYLGYSFIVVYLGGLLQFPDWMANLSPFGHIPQLPIEEMEVMKVSILTIIALVFIVAGFIGYKRRDIQG